MSRSRRAAGGGQYESLDLFYAARPGRKRSVEVDFGVAWRAGQASWPTYRLSWVEDTGELYLFHQAAPTGRGVAVRVLATIAGRPRIEEVLDGWGDACEADNGLLWIFDRVNRARAGVVPVEAIAEVLTASRFRYRNEADLQELVAETLTTGGFTVRREVDLGCGRVDLVVDRVGIEVKVDGPRASVARQLDRYAGSEDVDALLLVTNRVGHRSLAGRFDKPVGVLVVGGL